MEAGKDGRWEGDDAGPLTAGCHSVDGAGCIAEVPLRGYHSGCHYGDGITGMALWDAITGVSSGDAVRVVPR